VVVDVRSGPIPHTEAMSITDYLLNGLLSYQMA
jgi:hypothetical protein